MKVSVIVPVYNVEKYLDECVNSILSQTFTDFELILVDDGSKDSSGKMCDEWALKDSRIKVIHQENKGLSGARNTGIAAAQGEYLTIVDSDDLIDENMLSILAGQAEDEGLDAVWCSCYRFFNDDISTRSPRDIEEQTCTGKEEIIQNMILPIIAGYNTKVEVAGTMCMAMYRTSLIKDNGLVVPPVSEISGEDNLFNIEFLSFCNKVKWVNLPLYYYRKNPASLSNSIKDYTVPAIMNFEKATTALGEKMGIDRDELTKRNKIRVMISFSAVIKKVIDFNSLSQAKTFIKTRIQENGIDTSFRMDYLRDSQFQVALFWVLLKLRLYTPLYILVKIYSRFVTR